MPSISSFRQALLGGAALALVSVISVGSAHATVFGASAAFTDITTGNALTVFATPNPATLLTPNLTATVGHNTDYEAGFMLLGTKDTDVGLSCFLGCTNTDKISLVFNWTMPSTAASTSYGGSVEETTFALGSFDNGKLTWTNDTNFDGNGSYAKQTVTFADGAMAEFDVSTANSSAQPVLSQHNSTFASWT